MKAEDLMDLIGDADERIVEEAGQYRGVHTRRRVFIAAVAACVLLAGAAVAVTGNALRRNRGNDTPGMTGEDIGSRTEMPTPSSVPDTTEKKTETETMITQAPPSDDVPAQAASDRIVINRARIDAKTGADGMWDPNPNQAYMRHVTTLTFEELMDYYGLPKDLDTFLAGKVEAVLQEPVTTEEYSFFFFPWGVYRDEGFVYDVNTLGFRGKERTEDGGIREITVTFRKDTNILFPGRNVPLENDDPSAWELIPQRISECETSRIGGQECTILQRESFVDGEWVLYEGQYEVYAVIRGTEVVIDITGLSEEQVIALLKTVFVEARAL